MSVHNYTGAPCLNRWELFTEATNPDFQKQARDLCGTCPAQHFAACEQELNDQLDNRYHWPAGTWAARTFGDRGEITDRKPRKRKAA